MNAQRHLRIATIASIFLFLVIAGFALLAGTTTSIAARGNTGKALAFQAILATNKAKLFNTSPFVPFGRLRNGADGRFILGKDLLHGSAHALRSHAVPVVPAVFGPVQTFDTFAPPNSFTPLTTTTGTGTTAVTTTEPRVATNMTPVWSADETYLLFSSNRAADGSVAGDGQHFHIWAISANGSQAVQVTTSTPRANEDNRIPHGEFFPALDASNSQLAFTSDARSTNVQNLYAVSFQLGQAPIDVASLTQPQNSLTLRTDATLDFDNVGRPSWGGSGQLVFAARTTSPGPGSGHYHIYLLTLSSLGYDSGHILPAKLTNGAADDQNPAWASDGSYIAFDSTATGLNSTGSSLSGNFASSPLVTTTAGANGNHGIFVITASGTIPAGLSGSSGLLTSGAQDDVTPAWSFGAANPYSNPRGDTEYLSFARGASPSAAHDIYFLKAVQSVLQATDQSAPSNTATAQIAPAGFALYQVNAGGPDVLPFLADGSVASPVTFTGGAPAVFPGTPPATVTVAGVPNAAPPAVYQTYHRATPRDRSFTYTFPNLGPGASYTVRLHFAEPTATGTGQRVFDVLVNGAPVLPAHDIFAATGAIDVAEVKTLPGNIADGAGQLNIQFQSVNGDAIVNGIEIISEGTGRSVSSPSNGNPRVPQNVTAIGVFATQNNPSFITVSWDGVAGASSYNVYRSQSNGVQGTILYRAGVTSQQQGGRYFITDTQVVPGLTYTYYVQAVFTGLSSTTVFPEGPGSARRVNTQTLAPGATVGTFHNFYPAWSPFSHIFSIVYQSDRSITYTDPATGLPSETEISLPQGSAKPAIGAFYLGLLQSQVVNLDPPSLLRFNQNEIVHVNTGPDPLLPVSGGDETGGATHNIQPEQAVWFTVRLSDREAGIDDNKVYIQIKDPDSKYQDAQSIEHKVFAQDPTSPNAVANQLFRANLDGTLYAPGLTANSILYNGYGLGRPTFPDDRNGFQQFNPEGVFYQHGVIAGDRAGTPLSIGVNQGGSLSYLPPSADPTKADSILFGGNPNNFQTYGAEYECQYVNPTLTNPGTTLGDYGTPYYLAGFDDRTPFSGDDRSFSGSSVNRATGSPRPNTEWLQLSRAAAQDNKGGVLYTGKWIAPRSLSDYYIDVIGYDKAVYPFDSSVNTGNYSAENWRIYDNVWGVTSDGLNQSTEILLVSDNMLGQKFAATSFGGAQSFLSNLLPLFYGAESYVTDVDIRQLPDSGWYWVKENNTVEVYVVPFNLSVGSPIFPKNALGVNSILTAVNDDGVQKDGAPNVASMQYSIWRTLCRGPIDQTTLSQFGAHLSPMQPAVKNDALKIDVPAAQVPVANKCVAWFAPYANDLFTGPGTISDSTTQVQLANFVGSGGRLLVSGQDVVSATPNTDFVANTLHVKLVDGAGGTPLLSAGGSNLLGIAGSFLSNDYRKDPKWRTDGSLDQMAPSPTLFNIGFNGSTQYAVGHIDAVATAGSKADLIFTGGGNAGLTYYENPDATNGARVVYSSFGIEALGQEVVSVPIPGAKAPRDFWLECHNNRSKTMHNIVNYLRTGTFTGTVVDTTVGGAPQAATVYAVPSGGQLGVRAVYSATVNPGNGSYTITGVPPGTYTIYASQKGYVTSSSDGHGMEGGVVVRVGLNIARQPLGTIKGIVTDFYTGLPISGAQVQFTSQDGVYTYSGTTGATGVYTIVNVTTYEGGIKYDGVASKDPQYGVTSAQTVTLVPGQTVDGTANPPAGTDANANFVLTPTPGTITGRVFDTTTNAGVTGATVTVNFGGKTLQTVTTGANGVYTIKVGAGTYDITATKSSYTTATVSVTVVSNQTTSGHDIGITPIPPGYIGGSVINKATGQPAVGVSVQVFAVGATTPIATFTTSATTSPAPPAGDGNPLNYIGTIAEGTYTVVATDPTLGTATPVATGPITVTRNKFTRVDLAFNLGTLGGVVKPGPNSAPLSGVTVTITTAAGAPVATVTTGSVSSPGPPTGDGAPQDYQVFLPAGTYNITFSKSGLATSPPFQRTIGVGGFTRQDYIAPVLTTFPAGLQMISAPYDYSSFTLDALFGPDRSKLVIWQPQLLQYVVDPTPPADNLHLGYGYWIKLPHAVDFAFKGTAPTTGTVAVPLHAFWNQIGVPNTRAVSLAELQFLNPLTPGSKLTFADASGPKYNLVSPTVYGYDQASNTYVKVTTLQPWHGYWMKVYQDTTVYIPTTNP